MKKSIISICMLFAAVVIGFTSCQNAEEPVSVDQNNGPAIETRATAWANFARICYVEVNDVNPLNAGSYKLPDGSPFFTHVVLFASNIRGDASGNVHNYNNPNCAAILGNPAQYIKPLQDMGIKVIMGNLGDHTGAGFSNLTANQIDTYTNDLVAYANVVDGYDFDDEWAEYNTRGYPAANSTSFSNLILGLRAKTDKLITVFDWDLTYNINSAAAACVNFATQGGLNGYSTSPSFPIPLARYCPYFSDLTGPQSALVVKTRVTSAMNANAGGVTFFNLPMASTRLSTFNAAAQAAGLTATHNGQTFAKNYGN